MKEDAITMQQDRTPGFSFEDDKFERGWTKLTLRAIANKRDSLAPNEHLVKHPLEREYVSIYKVASAVVHAEADTFGKSFLNFYAGPDGSTVLMPVPRYAYVIAFFTARYDILQCHEVLKRVGIDPEARYVELMDKLLKIRDEEKPRTNI